MQTGFFQRGGAWVLGQAGLMIAIVVSGLVWVPDTQNPIARQVGACFLVVGAVCGVLGTISLGRNLTPFPGVSSRHLLVQTGIYAFMRHPLYTSLICASVGWSLMRGSWLAMVLSIALGVLLDAKARSEEASLTRRFPEYAEYKRQVKKFLPWLY